MNKTKSALENLSANNARFYETPDKVISLIFLDVCTNNANKPVY